MLEQGATFSVGADRVAETRFALWEGVVRSPEVYRYPVRLEPPFMPYGKFVLPADQPPPDPFRYPDSHELDASLAASSSDQESGPDPEHDMVVYVPVPQPAQAELPLVEFGLEDGPVDPDGAVAFLAGLRQCTHPVGFEVIGTGEGVSLQFACRDADEALLADQLTRHFPDVAVTRRSGFLEEQWGAQPDESWYVKEFTLQREFMIPLAPLDEADGDPVAGVIAAMGELEKGESAVVQVNVQPALAPWEESILAASVEEGIFPRTSLVTDVVRGAALKVAEPLFACLVRVAVQGGDTWRNLRLSVELSDPLKRYSASPYNRLVEVESNYAQEVLGHDLIARRGHRCGQLLNESELFALVHPPLAAMPEEPSVRRWDRQLEKRPHPPEPQTTAGGYRVRVRARAVGAAEEEQKRQAISRVIANAVRRQETGE